MALVMLGEDAGDDSNVMLGDSISMPLESLDLGTCLFGEDGADDDGGVKASTNGDLSIMAELARALAAVLPLFFKRTVRF